MFKLPESLTSHDTDTFTSTFKQEVCSLDSSLLPLQQGLQHSSYAIADKLSVSVLSTNDENNTLIIKAGLLYSGVIAGCSCADDPSPTDEVTEYCEVIFSIDKDSACATVQLLK